MTKAELKTSLTAKLQKCQQIIVNGSNYFGELVPKNKEGITVVKNAIETPGNLETTVKAWIKADTTGKLTSLSISGETQIVSKEITAADQDVIDVVIIKAANAIANAVAELQSDSIK